MKILINLNRFFLAFSLTKQFSIFAFENKKGTQYRVPFYKSKPASFTSDLALLKVVLTLPLCPSSPTRQMYKKIIDKYKHFFA